MGRACCAIGGGREGGRELSLGFGLNLNLGLGLAGGYGLPGKTRVLHAGSLRGGLY